MMNATSVTINTDSMGGKAAAPPKKNIIQQINDVNKMELPKLLRYMRISNVICSILQIIAGITGITSFITLNITGTLVSIYVIMFGFLFLLFECRLSRMEAMIRQNFGFLYTYKGRAGFIFFIGFLDFGMSSALGTVAGILMCVNAFINLMVMCRHPDFKAQLSALPKLHILGCWILFHGGWLFAAAALSYTPGFVQFLLRIDESDDP